MPDPAWLGEPPAYDRLPERFNIVSVLVDRHVAVACGDVDGDGGGTSSPWWARAAGRTR